MIKVFITGATGQVGSHIVEYIVQNRPMGIEKSEQIRCLVRNPQNARWLKNLGVEIVKGDLSESQKLREFLEDVTCVFHVAASVYVYSPFEEMYQTNVVGTKNLLDAFVNSKGHLFVHTSSIIVYDSPLKGIAKKSSYPNRGVEFREDSPWGPIEEGKDIPYAVTKRLGEKLVSEYAQRHTDKFFIITRLGPIIGPRDRQMIPALIQSLKLPVPKLISRGATKIHLTSPEDVARAQIFLAQIAIQKDKQTGEKQIKSGDVFNIANELVSFKELFNIVAEYYGYPSPKLSIPKWFFRLFKPTLKLIRVLFPKNLFVQSLLSPSALNYMEHTYIYNSDKLKSLGFKYQVPIRQSIIMALNSYVAVVFDFDGTLIDSKDVKTANYVEAFFKIFKPKEKYRDTVKESCLYTSGANRFIQLQDTLQRLGLQTTEEQKQLWSREYSRLNAEALSKIEEFPSVRKTLEILKKNGYHLYAASGILDEEFKRELKRRGLDTYFLGIEGGDKLGSLKKLKESGYKRIIFVGDTKYDKKTAEEAKTEFFMINSDEDIKALKNFLLTITA